ncbi:MAG: putative metal-binding motif-containing protein [Sandaracinaceae bacterium]
MVWWVCFLGGCSLLGLTDVPPQGECDRCEELNLIELPPDCMSWQCGADNMCVVDLIDQDGDGAPFERCALDERPADCDDLDGANTPGNAEECDARSNDCDEAIDEGLELVPTVLASTGELAGVSWARIAEGRFVAAGFTTERSMSLVEADDPMQIRPVPLPALGASTSVAAFGEERAVLYAGSECGAMRVLRWGRDVTVAASDALPRFGGCNGDNPMVAPVLALDSERRGLALSQTETRETCVASGGGRLFASLITRDDMDWNPEPAALPLGRHDGLGPPALLALDELDFVVARVEAETLHLTQVEVSAADLSLTARELHSEPCGASCGFVSLASAVIEGVRQLGLAFRAGGCADGELRLLRFTVDGTTVTRIDEALSLASGDPSRVALAARPEAPSWAVAWSDAGSVQVERAPSEAPIAAISVPTVGRVEEAMSLAYSDAMSIAVYDPNTPALTAASLDCPPREEPAEE